MISEKKYLQPTTVTEAINLAKENAGHYKYISGGTDLMATQFQGNDNSAVLIDLTNIENMTGVTERDGYVYIGALERLSELKNHKILVDNFPSLVEAAHSVGSPLIRNSATLGGNILCENRCLYYNQSEWWRNSIGYCLKCEGDICIATGGDKKCFSELVSDTAPVLISMDAKIKISGSSGEKIIPLEDIYTGDGVKPLKLEEIVIVEAILLPLGRGFKTNFNKLRQRKSLEFTSLTSCVSVDNNGKVIIALSGVDPGPVIVNGTTESNREELIKLALKGSRAIDNDMLTRKYRREILKTYLNNSFNKLNPH